MTSFCLLEYCFPYLVFIEDCLSCPAVGLLLYCFRWALPLRQWPSLLLLACPLLWASWQSHLSIQSILERWLLVRSPRNSSRSQQLRGGDEACTCSKGSAEDQ